MKFLGLNDKKWKLTELAEVGIVRRKKISVIMTKRRFIGDEIMVSVMKFEVGISICSRNWMNFVKEPGFLGEIYHFRD